MTDSNVIDKDPYVGSTIFDDYQYCRFGHTPNMKKMNLCLYDPNNTCKVCGLIEKSREVPITM